MEVKVVTMTEDMALVEGSAYVDRNLVAKGKLSFISVNIDISSEGRGAI